MDVEMDERDGLGHGKAIVLTGLDDHSTRSERGLPLSMNPRWATTLVGASRGWSGSIQHQLRKKVASLDLHIFRRPRRKSQSEELQHGCGFASQRE
jgi:hypothetical protein